MPYEIGSYMKELKAAHKNGEHLEKYTHCPRCNPEGRIPEGFDSWEDYNRALHEGAAKLQVEIDDLNAAHVRGEHKGIPEEKRDSLCDHCMKGVCTCRGNPHMIYCPKSR